MWKDELSSLRVEGDGGFFFSQNTVVYMSSPDCFQKAPGWRWWRCCWCLWTGWCRTGKHTQCLGCWICRTWGTSWASPTTCKEERRNFLTAILTWLVPPHCCFMGSIWPSHYKSPCCWIQDLFFVERFLNEARCVLSHYNTILLFLSLTHIVEAELLVLAGWMVMCSTFCQKPWKCQPPVQCWESS